MNEDLEIDIIDEEDDINIEDIDFVPVLEPTRRHVVNHRIGSRYVSKILFNYVILYSIVVLIIMNFLSTILNKPATALSNFLDVDSNLILAVISAILLVLFNVISILVGIKSNSNFRKGAPININFVHVRIMFFAFILPILNSIVSIVNFYLYVKDEVSDYYTTSFLLLNALVLILNPIVLLTISKKLKKII